MTEVSSFYEANNYPYPANYILGKHISFNAPKLDKKTILVAGCGTIEACLVAWLNPQSGVVGIDFSEASIAIAKSIRRKYKITNLLLSRHDITNLPETYDGIFDLVLMNGVLHHIPDKYQALVNISKSMKTNGIFRGFVYSDNRPECIRRLNTKFLEEKFTIDSVIQYLEDNIDFEATEWYKKYVQTREEIADTWLHPYFREYNETDLYNLLSLFFNHVKVGHIASDQNKLEFVGVK